MEAHLTRISEACEPHYARRRYMNFIEADVEPSECFDVETLERLRRVKAQVDPDGMFLANHPLGVEQAVPGV